jgi:hypothetical protein
MITVKINKILYTSKKNKEIEKPRKEVLRQKVDKRLEKSFINRIENILSKYPIVNDNTIFFEKIMFNYWNIINFYFKQKKLEVPKCKETIEAYLNASIRILELAIYIKSNNLDDFENLYFNTNSIDSCFYVHFITIQLNIFEDNRDLLTIKKDPKNKNRVTVFIGNYGKYMPESIPKPKKINESERKPFWFSKYFKLDELQIKDIFKGNGSSASGSISSGRKGERKNNKFFETYNYLDESTFSNINLKFIENHEERLEVIQKDSKLPSIIFENTNNNILPIRNKIFQNISSNYKQHLINKAISNSLAKNEMFLCAKAPNIKLFSKLVIKIIGDDQNYYSSLILISIFTGLRVKELLYIFTDFSEEITYLSTYSIFRIKVNCALFANYIFKNHEITKKVRNIDSNFFLPNFLQKLCLSTKEQLKNVIRRSKTDNKFNRIVYDNLIEQELKNISKALYKHKKSISKNIAHVNIKSLHKLLIHYFHILNEKTDTSILLLNNLSKNNQARACYTVRQKRLINYENWIINFYNILTNNHASTKAYDTTKNEFIGSPMFVESHIFKNFLLSLFEVKTNNRFEKLNLQMIFIRYTLSILLATRSSRDGCNLMSYSKNLSLLTIHQKAKNIKSSKRLIPLTSRAIEYIELFYELKKEFDFHGFTPILFKDKDNELVQIELNKNSVLEFLEAICDQQLFIRLKKFIKSTELNMGRHIVASKAIYYNFNREFENEFMGHYSKAKLGLGIYSNFDIQKYITSTKTFMKKIEDDYFPTYNNPRNFK